MANAPKSSFGGIIGIVIAVVLVGGIAASPFYLGKFRAEDAAFSAAAGDNLEVVRRVILDLDQHLGALADMDAAIPDGEKLTPEAAEQIKGKQADALNEELQRSLNQTAQLLRDVESRDQQRHVTYAGSTPSQAGQSGLGAAIGQMKREYLTANAKLRQQAQAAVDSLKSLARGGTVGAGVLAASRIQATFYYAIGKLHGNRADFEQQQTAACRYAALQRLAASANLQRELASLEAQSPTKAIDNVKNMLRDIDGRIAEVDGKLSKLRPLMDDLSAQQADLERTAAEAHAKMAEMEADGKLGVHRQNDLYLSLANTARQAEAKAAALLNGAAPASPAPAAVDEESAEVEPEGEAPARGLRDLTFRKEQWQQDLSVWQAGRADLQEQQENLQRQEESIDSQRRKAQAAVAESRSEVSALLKEADRHREAANKAAADASTAFKQANTAVQEAVRAATQRTTNAAAKARSSGGTPNELMELISKDGDTEISLQCLAAEISYSAALLDVRAIQDLKDHAAAAGIVRQLGGEEAAAKSADDVQTLRQQATNALAEAAKNYERAEKLLGSASAKAPTGTISGSNYLWQVQIGEAAVQLLRASLAGLVDGTPDREAQDKAYELLTKAAQGREQSPLLATALDTLEYLQQTAR